MSEHKRLAEELYQRGFENSEEIASLIIEERKRICQPLIKCNEILEKVGEEIGITMFAYEYASAIGKTLKLAGLEKE